MDSETNRRILAGRTYISYGALKRNTVPCSRRGASYYNGAPDVFTSLAALRAGHYRTGLAAILSAGTFVSALFVGFVAIYAAPFALDPSVSFGPAVVSWTWDNHWIYWVGPLIGGGLAGLIYEVVFISHTHEQLPIKICLLLKFLLSVLSFLEFFHSC